MCLKYLNSEEACQLQMLDHHLIIWTEGPTVSYRSTITDAQGGGYLRQCD